MSKSYSANISDEIKETKEEISKSNNHHVPIKSVQGWLNEADKEIKIILRAASGLSELDLFEGNRFQSELYSDIQNIRQFRDQYRQNNIDNDLYYYILDIYDDFDICRPTIILPTKGLKFQTIQRRFKNRFELDHYVDIGQYDEELYKKWLDDLNRHDCYILGLPVGSIRNPLNFAFLIHELLHVSNYTKEGKTQLVSEIERKIDDEFDDVFGSETINEVAIDLLSLHYTGPIYALQMVNRARSRGYIRDNEKYPSLEERIKYGQNYLSYIYNKDVWGKNVHPIFETIRGQAERELDDALDDVYASGAYSEETFTDLHTFVEGKLQMENVALFIDEVQKLRKYLAMPITTESKVSEKLDKFLLDTDRSEDKKLAIPAKPTILLNLLLEYPREDVKDLHQTVLISFKKWRVSKNTIY